MPIYPSLTQGYAKAIYINGTKHFSDIKPEYAGPVKQYAADNYYINEIDNALALTYISQQEYDETMVLKGPEDPQYDTSLLSAPTE